MYIGRPAPALTSASLGTRSGVLLPPLPGLDSATIIRVTAPSMSIHSPPTEEEIERGVGRGEEGMSCFCRFE
jgi:hypothetical protein